MLWLNRSKGTSKVTEMAPIRRSRHSSDKFQGRVFMALGKLLKEESASSEPDSQFCDWCAPRLPTITGDLVCSSNMPSSMLTICRCTASFKFYSFPTYHNHCNYRKGRVEALRRNVNCPTSQLISGKAMIKIQSCLTLKPDLLSTDN